MTNQMGPFSGKSVLVTGADSGLGLCFAERFHRQGAFVVLAVHSAANVRHPLLSDRSFVIEGDLTEPGYIQKLIDLTVGNVGQPDILVNNAAIRSQSPFMEVSHKQWLDTIEVNLRVPFFLSQEIAKLLVAAGKPGSIVNVASHLGLVSARDHSLYCITKAGLIAMTRSLSVELARVGISVNAVAPGPTNTAGAGLFRDENDIVDFLHRAPIGRRVEPDEVADAVEFLAQRPGGAVSGHTLVVDGGWTTC